ncbi:transporter substrate-binding domain-containing protein [Devosia sp.]|uniref:transporter substrate-binding domain-containing protein n=1 Tax=Devosia sp. TaxID=1871048 RepID=UPI0019DB657D|nr:transporter substrate-binding domain-containing protein [Devosia sp.]MBE0578778.1 transporter substrate-binding domain-containing protein [Devosia sp.]
MKLTKTASAFCVIAAALLSQSIWVQAQELPPLPQDIQDAGVLRIGVKCDTPPFGFSGPDGQPIGIEVEMAKQIAVYAFGSPDKAELTCVTSEARIPSLEADKIDLVLATLGKTQTRAEVVDFTHSYYWGTSSIVVPKDSPIQTLADLAGKTVLGNKGGSQARWFEANMPDTEVMQLNTTADSLQSLLQGRADAYAGDGEVIATIASNNPELRVLEEGFDLGANGIGISKNQPELLAFLDAAIAKMKADKFHAGVVPNFVDNPGLIELMIKNFENDAPPEAEMRK